MVESAHRSLGANAQDWLLESGWSNPPTGRPGPTGRTDVFHERGARTRSSHPGDTLPVSR
jgi:hypothetical protein